VGAFAGPLIAIALMAATSGSFRTVFALAVIPAIVAVALLVWFVDEPSPTASRAAAAGDSDHTSGTAGLLDAPSTRALLGSLGQPYRWLVLVAALFTLARFSEAFLILKIADVGLSAAYVPAVLVVMNVMFAASAYPAGRLSDRFGRWLPLGVGATLLIAADLVLAFATSLGATLLGIAVWGLHMGCTQGLFAALVADASAPEYRGTAFGVFNFVTGLALLGASVLAGVLWDAAGPAATFLAGAALTAAAGLAALALYAAGALPSGRQP
jgi:MFS family permease